MGGWMHDPLCVRVELSVASAVVSHVYSASLVTSNGDVRLLIDLGEGGVERLWVAIIKGTG